MDVHHAQHVFIVGIKGVAMANLAIILSQMGKKVTGSDVDEEFITDETLQKYPVTILKGFSDPLPKDIDVVIYSAAHGGTTNDQVKTARERSIPALHQVTALAQIMDRHEVRIAVCGSHGKTTTTSMLAHALCELGVDPSYMIGSSTFGDHAGGAFGHEKYMVVEADEYALDPPRDVTPKFLHLHPTHTICTNIDFDHPDVFPTLDAVKQAFKTFFTDNASRVFACGDDVVVTEVVAAVPSHRVKMYSLKDATVLANNEGTVVTVDGATYTLPVSPGKLLGNALGVIAVLRDLGFSPDNIQKALATFKGPKRRFEQVGTVGKIDLYDDYAHHPKEIETTIQAAQDRFGKKRRIIVIFQPHTYSRTQALKDEFIDALSKADVAYVAPIFASARETIGEATITSAQLAADAAKKGISNLHSFTSVEELQQLLRGEVRPNDVIMTMGAGDIYKVKSDIIRAIESA
jgi:UDP-N-acetylmuramate--alanine ligase